jgi:hypothetical protein
MSVDAYGAGTARNEGGERTLPLVNHQNNRPTMTHRRLWTHPGCAAGRTAVRLVALRRTRQGPAHPMPNLALNTDPTPPGINTDTEELRDKRHHRQRCADLSTPERKELRWTKPAPSRQ